MIRKPSQSLIMRENGSAYGWRRMAVGRAGAFDPDSGYGRQERMPGHPVPAQTEPGHAVDFPRESHSSTGKASAGLALLWGLLFFARVPMLYRQFTPGYNALLLMGAVLLAIFTVVSGWFVSRSKAARIKIMAHQAIGYFFIILIAALLLLAVQENFFPESLAL